MNDVFRRSSGVAFRQFGSECLLVPIRTSPTEDLAVYSLNPVGAFLWSALAEPASAEDLSARTAAAFEVSEADARRDVVPFLEQLLSRRLIDAVNL